MAVEVSYYQDVISDEERATVYREGPFVICNPLRNGYRIEVEVKNHICPALPDSSIIQLMESRGLVGKTREEERAIMMCDYLNEQVKLGKIVLRDGWWVVSV